MPYDFQQVQETMRSKKQWLEIGAEINLSLTIPRYFWVLLIMSFYLNRLCADARAKFVAFSSSGAVFKPYCLLRAAACRLDCARRSPRFRPVRAYGIHF